MPKPVLKRSKKKGLAPGTLMYIGEKSGETVRISYMDYDEKNFQEKQVSTIEECFEFKSTSTVTWIIIDGLNHTENIEKIGKEYGLHPLVQEDILNTSQRPKFVDYDSSVYVVLKMLSFNNEKKLVESEQVSLVLGNNFVISFQETIGDVFDQIRERIRNSKGRIRKLGPDYLCYSLFDAVVDGYFEIIEKLGEQIESMEEELVINPTEKTLHKIHSLKREMISLRKSVWPLRELINAMQRSETFLIKEQTDIYLRDIYDHTIQVIDTIESFRDIASGMLDIYLSSLSNRMNAVMKTLTVIATIFIPLTFFAGVYGMNFKHMPELEEKWAYPYGFWTLILIILSLMLTYFKRKKWF
ncbi:MAG: magnesium/cobalt transporter CorA [Candidatus Atribacteria bacterium]|nr:MAG: magnesium/cobalt transporter CorA [Candidatus Atribacteria bacterium]